MLGRETVVRLVAAGMALWRDRLFAVMHRNASSAVEHFRLPLGQVVEIGTQVEI